MHRDGKPKGFFYLDHRTVDSKYNIITDTFVTPGNINDVKPYPERLLYQIKKFGFNVSAVGLDAGFNTSQICKFLHDLGIDAAMGHSRGCSRKESTANINCLFEGMGCIHMSRKKLPRICDGRQERLQRIQVQKRPMR